MPHRANCYPEELALRHSTLSLGPRSCCLVLKHNWTLENFFSFGLPKCTFEVKTLHPSWRNRVSEAELELYREPHEETTDSDAQAQVPARGKLLPWAPQMTPNQHSQISGTWPRTQTWCENKPCCITQSPERNRSKTRPTQRQQEGIEWHLPSWQTDVVTSSTLQQRLYNSGGPSSSWRTEKNDG